MKKLVCLLLAAIMAVGTLSSCAKNTEVDDTESTGGQSAATSGAVEETEEALEIPDTKYNDLELTFLSRDEGEWSTNEIFSEKIDSKSDNIAVAVYERNDIIRQKYGVIIREYKKNTTEHHSAVSKEVQAPTGDFSAITTSAANGCSFVSQGFLWNLNSDANEYIDLSKSWWDANMNKSLSIGDRLYFTTGDIMTLDNDATFTMLFNKSIAKEYNIPDLYQLVADQKWTMDKLLEFEKQAHSDVNGDGLTYDTDIYGLAYTQDTPYAMVYAGGLKVTEKDDEGMPTYAFDVERGQNVAEKVKLIFGKDNAIHMNKLPVDILTAGQKCFGEGHALFMSEVLQNVTRMRGFDIDFGIVPHPKFDEAQETYQSMMHFTGSIVCIPKSVTEDSANSLTMVESMIEAMAYLSKSTLTVQYYEINLKTKHSKDEQSGPMIDMILANRVFDMGYYYSWGNAVGTITESFDPTSSSSVASQSKKAQRACEKAISRFLRTLDKNEQAG